MPTRIGRRRLPIGGANLDPPYPFFGEGSPSKIDYRKKGALILTFYWRT